MWTYKQSSGQLWHGDPEPVATGYSGAEPDGKNNPTMQDVRDIGPIPCGAYTIGSPRNSPTHGPFALPLSPDPDNEMFGRSEFLMHGDSIEHPGQASEGCIIMPRNVRERVWNSSDHRLTVMSE